MRLLRLAVAVVALWAAVPSSAAAVPPLLGGDVTVALDHGESTQVGVVAADPLGRMLAVSNVEPSSAFPDRVLERFGIDGTPDPTFGSEGAVALDERFQPIAMRADALGVTLVGNWHPRLGGRQVAVLRLGLLGAPDPAYGPDGLVIQPVEDGWDTLEVAEIRADRSVVAVVRHEVPIPPEEPAPPPVHRIVWLGTDGAVDPSHPDLVLPFESDADSTTVPAAVGVGADGAAHVLAVTILPNLVTRSAVLRVTPAGELDAGYGEDGAATTATFSTALDVLPDGSVVGAGPVNPLNPLVVTWKLTPAGEPDITYGASNGMASVPVMSHAVRGVVALPSGHVAVVGSPLYQRGGGTAIHLLEPDGRPSVAFDGDGTRVLADEVALTVAEGAPTLGAGPTILVGAAVTDDEGRLRRIELPVPQPGPTAVSASARNGGLSVSWAHPSGGPPVLQYHLIVFEDGQGVTTRTVPGDVRQTTVTDLENARPHEVVVIPIHAGGLGTSSARAGATPSVAAPSATVPAATTAVRARVHQGAATVTWGPPANDGGAPIDGYSVITIDSRNGRLHSWRQVRADVRSASVTRLAAGVVYRHHVVANNARGLGSGGTGAVSTSSGLAGAPAPPGPPAFVTATTGVGNLWIQWGPAPERGQPVTGYQLILLRDGDVVDWRALSATARSINFHQYDGPLDVYVVATSATAYGTLPEPIHVDPSIWL